MGEQVLRCWDDFCANTKFAIFITPNRRLDIPDATATPRLRNSVNMVYSNTSTSSQQKETRRQSFVERSVLTGFMALPPDRSPAVDADTRPRQPHGAAWSEFDTTPTVHTPSPSEFVPIWRCRPGGGGMCGESPPLALLAF
jgi:hypothetical protein